MNKTTQYSIRKAQSADYAAVTAAVTQLLRELSGNESRTLENAAAVYSDLISDSGHGGVLVAETTEPDHRIVGVLTYSFEHALRAGGRYCTLQELWVESQSRGLGVGDHLIAHLGLTVSGECSRIEVGLPSSAYPGISATSRFYEHQGFEPIGLRAVKKLG